MAVVYQHRRKDNNEIFYVGVGKQIHRAGRRCNRNEHWHNIDKKHGFKWEILITGLTMEAAFEIEKGLIKYYGTVYNRTGKLVNQTAGGDGRIALDKPTYLEFKDKYELRDYIFKYHPNNKRLN